MNEMHLFDAGDNRSWLARTWYKTKALLTSRADTLKQSDAVTDMLMDKLAQSAAALKIAEEAASRFARLVIQQHAALVVARDLMAKGIYPPDTEPQAIFEQVVSAIEASAAQL